MKQLIGKLWGMPVYADDKMRDECIEFRDAETGKLLGALSFDEGLEAWKDFVPDETPSQTTEAKHND